MALAMRQSKTALQSNAPLVDGLLALFVLLLVAAPLLARALAPAAMGSAPAAPELRLDIGRTGEYALDGRPLAPAALAAALRQAQARAPALRLRIATSDDGDPNSLVGALAAAERAGVRNIGSELR